MMNIQTARSILGKALEDTKKLGPPNTALLKGLDEIHKQVNAVRAGGYDPSSMGPLLLLVNEIHKQQEQQGARIISLMQGIERIRG